MYNELELENEGGTLSGYKVNANSENYKNFLKSELDEKVADKIIQFIEKKNYNSIVIIKNVNVEEDMRGQGLGRSLVEDAISEADISILVSDKYESQVNGLVLDNFYKGSDFEKVTNASGGSLMIFPSNAALEMKAELNNVKRKRKLKM